MATFILLIIIYLAFISLGLPDALLGVAWPLIREDWSLALDAAGAISIVVTLGTISSSLLSGKLIKRFGEGKITLFSGLLTSFALLGYAVSPSYIWFIILALPLGFGAGSVDTALNHFVSLHFKAHHMNWLHSFWGIGATAGPLLMGSILTQTHSWRLGYQTVGLIQLGLAMVILISLPLWKKYEKENNTPLFHTSQTLEDTNSKDTNSKSKNSKNQNNPSILKIKGVPYALGIFMFYCAAEFSMGLWGSSYLIATRGLSLEIAARWVAFYYAGITIGRIASGFISFKLSNRQMINLGLGCALLGSALLISNLSNVLVMLAFVIIGLGFAPIFPAMVHETPTRFGKNAAQTIIGYQMASAYVGIAVFPPLFGWVIAHTSMALFPIFILICVLMLCGFTYRINQV